MRHEGLRREKLQGSPSRQLLHVVHKMSLVVIAMGERRIQILRILFKEELAHDMVQTCNASELLGGKPRTPLHSSLHLPQAEPGLVAKIGKPCVLGCVIERIQQTIILALIEGGNLQSLREKGAHLSCTFPEGIEEGQLLQEHFHLGPQRSRGRKKLVTELGHAQTPEMPERAASKADRDKPNRASRLKTAGTGPKTEEMRPRNDHPATIILPQQKGCPIMEQALSPGPWQKRRQQLVGVALPGPHPVDERTEVFGRRDELRLYGRAQRR